MSISSRLAASGFALCAYEVYQIISNTKFNIVKSGVILIIKIGMFCSAIKLELIENKVDLDEAIGQGEEITF